VDEVKESSRSDWVGMRYEAKQASTSEKEQEVNKRESEKVRCRRGSELRKRAARIA